MENRAVYMVFIALASTAILFQVIGFFAPAWLIIKVHIGNQNPPTTTAAQGLPTRFNWNDNTDFGGEGGSADSMDSGLMKVETKLGLWFITACAQILGIWQCQSASLHDIQTQLHMVPVTGATEAGEEIFGSFTTQQILATLALLCCIVGTIMTIVFSCKCPEKATLCKGMIICSSMAFSGVFLFAAVGIQVQNQKRMEGGMDRFKEMTGGNAVMNGLNSNFGFAWALLMSGLGAGLSVVHAIMVALFVCFKRNGADTVPWNRFNNAAI